MKIYEFASKRMVSYLYEGGIYIILILVTRGLSFHIYIH